MYLIAIWWEKQDVLLIATVSAEFPILEGGSTMDHSQMLGPYHLGNRKWFWGDWVYNVNADMQVIHVQMWNSLFTVLSLA